MVANLKHLLRTKFLTWYLNYTQFSSQCNNGILIYYFWVLIRLARDSDVTFCVPWRNCYLCTVVLLCYLCTMTQLLLVVYRDAIEPSSSRVTIHNTYLLWRNYGKLSIRKLGKMTPRGIDRYHWSHNLLQNVLHLQLTKRWYIVYRSLCNKWI